MRRRLNAIWIPLLAALLAGPPAQRVPAWATGASVRQLEALAPVLGLPRATIRLLSAPDPRSSIDRHGSHTWALLPGAEPTATGTPRLHRLDPRGDRGLLPESSRHFPLFPTGPPHHS